MTYTRVNWKDTPETPTDAAHFNIMDEGIEDAHNGNNAPVFETFDDQGQETLMEVEPIVQGDTMAVIISKITKYTNNVRYLIELLNESAMQEAGYNYVGNAIADLAKKITPQFAYMWLTEMSTIKGAYVPFNQNVVIGDAFSFSDGKITAESEDVAYVRVSATIGGNSTNGRGWMRIYRERDGVTTTIGDAIQYGDFFSPSVTVMCQCRKGDIFYVYVYEETTVRGGGVGCYFTIEKIG